MDNQYIVSKINEYLHRAKGLLVSRLDEKLKKISVDWWNECVLDRLSFRQREIAIEKNFKELSDFDLATVLRIADKNWYDMRNFAYIQTSERECIRDMRSVRNNWVHCAGNLPGKDSIVRDIDVLIKFFEQMGAASADVNQLEEFKRNVQNENIAGMSQTEEIKEEIIVDDSSASAAEIKEIGRAHV